MPKTDTLGQTALWFERAIPEPSSKNLHTQLGCHFEEVGEMLNALETDDMETACMLLRAEIVMGELALHLKTHEDLINKPKRTELLDAICDQIVTATGVGHMFGYPVKDALTEINASNWSKFVDGLPVFDENMKIQKGPAYFKARLSQFI